jgi:serine/threonine protein kinase
MGYRFGTRTMGTKTNASALDMPKTIPEEGHFHSTYTMSFVRGGKSINRSSPALRQAGGISLSSPAGGGISLISPAAASSKSPATAKLAVPAGGAGFGLIGSGLPESQEMSGLKMKSLTHSVSAPQMLQVPVPSSASSRNRRGDRTPQPQARKSTTHYMREARRALLETLADPDVEQKARDVFKTHDKDNSDAIEPSELIEVLDMLHREMGIEKADEKAAMALFKRYDLDTDNKLKFPDFFMLFIAELRRAAFDRSTLFGREFFVTKQEGRPWDAFDRVKELGTGSFGTAYLCKHKRTKEDYVVKAVKKSRVKIPVEDVEQEIMVMRQVDHPHLVRLFEWYEDTGRVYLVLEALKGGTLKDVIMQFQKLRKGLKEQWIREVTRQTMEAISYCHSLRLVHKDIKDENLMLLQQDVNFDKPFVVVIDLGIAEMFSLSDPTGQECGGTPTTMAPEVWNGCFGPKCDVFSLGCVLYEMMAGCLPFIARSLRPVQWIRLHKKGADFSKCTASGQGKDLCKLMLTYSDIDRPSMAECMKHDWFSTDAREMKTVPPAQLQALQNFCNEAALKRTLLLEMAARLPMSRCGEIIELFEAFDANRDGTLTAEELRSAFRSFGIQDEKLIGKIFKSLDVDHDGFLSFSEFAAGVLCVFGDLVEERMHTLFMESDENSDGVLDRSEAEDFLANAALLLKKDPKSRSTAMLQELLTKGAAGMKYEELMSRIFGKPAPSATS